MVDRAQRAEAARAARREEILNAARRVFADRGFKGTTIADIAEAAGIALGTIYIYFKSKEDVFRALQQRFSDMLTKAMSTPSDDPSLEALVRARVDRVFDVCGANRDLVRLVVLNTDYNSDASRRQRTADEGRFQPMVDALTQAAKTGFIRDADPCIMTKLTWGLVSIAVYQAFVMEDGDAAENYRDECAAMITAYLAPVQS